MDSKPKSDPALEYIESRTSRRQKTRQRTKERVEAWKEKRRKGGWSPVCDDRSIALARRLRWEPLMEPRSDLENKDTFWLPVWLQELAAGDTSQAKHLLHGPLKDLPEEDQVVGIVQELLKPRGVPESRRARYLYWLELRRQRSTED